MVGALPAQLFQVELISMILPAVYITQPIAMNESFTKNLPAWIRVILISGFVMP